MSYGYKDPRHRARPRLAARAAILALIGAGMAPTAPAQNRDHPGLVFADKNGWVTPAAASETGFVEYQRRWVPKSRLAKLAAWEKEDRLNATWKNAWKTESKHYRITTNVPRFIVEDEIKPFLDALYDVYTEVFRKDFGLSGKGANKKFIRIHHGYESYVTHEADESGPPPRTTPGFILGGSELVTYYEDTEPAIFYATAFHEGLHQFVEGMLPGARLPMWLDEALATYFEGCTWSRATRKITVGHFPVDRISHAIEILAAVKDDDPRLAERLFMNVPDSGFDAEHYALAWSFVYYVTHVENGKHRVKFSRFLRATNGAGVKPIPEVFEESTGLRLFDMQKGWREFVLSLKPEPLPEHVFLSVEGGDDPAADVRNGDIVWSIDDREVFDASVFEKAWKDRAKDRPTKLVLTRRTPAPKPVEWREAFVTTLVKPGSTVKLGVASTSPREYCLRD